MNNTDPTSFQSILAGVKKLREQEGGKEDDSKKKAQSQSSRTPSQPIQASSGPVVNAFNQQRIIPGEGTNTDKDFSRKRPFTGSNSNSVLVNTTQKENPLLNHLKNTNWRYISSTGGNKIYYDYLVRSRSILFLTLSYHRLYADYIARRMLPLSKNENNILIFVVDDINSEDPLKDLTKLCMFNGFTLLVAFNFEQAANYLRYLNQ
ncbi:DNA repair protein RAD10 NDAI_0K00190 [Naumovozyma dairenensis CBS 421]|uniref:ERCC1-like central domain-containing protein n=1 Tax=Naumovozyma dairenensis (strain ATCC 10597 / BCRC 20456 / CBS 421 / NBRC 0211 / NRRL Y-12639) TaxID=1071378 RepID=G0WHE7_NAUDC|nr:hypothetical protein NDAI_0K00190 [Naumovozyma dairenensis CBS 421]CCD27208.1 hypothetical protein NDAI_0K00190 [Naumovozyma dairenensis CBS 421]